MALFLSRKSEPHSVVAEPLVVPRPSVDGWTLEGTRLWDRVNRNDARELATLLHGIAIKVDTPWTYERAAEMLDAIGEAGLAYAVCTAWLALPEAAEAVNAQGTKTITRQSNRLRARLATAPVQAQAS